MSTKSANNLGFTPIIILIFIFLIGLIISGIVIFKNKIEIPTEVVNSSNATASASPTIIPIKTKSPTTKPKISATPTKYPTATPTANNAPTSNPTTHSSTPTPTPIPSQAPILRVVSPNGGESFTEGDLTTISWDVTGGQFSSFSILYSDCPSCASNITNVNGSTRSYVWRVDVGNTTNTKFKIEIIGFPNTNNPNAIDYSDSDFTVTQSPI